MNKKAIYYTIDAMLAGILITGALALIIINPFYDSSYSSRNYLSQDLLNSLSAIKISDIDHHPFIINEINSGEIDDVDISVLEQIGKYWALEYEYKARNLTELVLSSLNLSSKKITLKMGNDTIMDLGEGRSSDISVSRRMIAGIDKGKPMAGTSASAYLRRIRDKRMSAYHYFGGFSGQGRLSFFIEDLPEDIYENNISRVDNIYLEGDFQDDFHLFINGALCESSPGNVTFLVHRSSLVVDSWNLPHCKHLINESVRNDFEIDFLSSGYSSASVSGGFLRIDYRTDELQQSIKYGENTYFFPGVDGVANIYDSFFIPGNLQEMNIYLHFETDQSAYISVGERILAMNTGGDEDILSRVVHERDGDKLKVWINNSFLLNEANFDYEQLSVNNVPLRFAAYEVTSEIFESGDADIVIITDFSGSMMKAVADWNDQGFSVNDCGRLYDSPRARKSHLARCLSADLVDVLMNYSGNRVWPVFFHDNKISWYNNPEDGLAIRSYISGFGPQGKGETCIACAINQAYDILNTYGDPDRPKFVVLMSDGAPTHCAQGSCSSVSATYGAMQCVGFCDTSGASGCKDDEMVGCMEGDTRCVLAESNAIFSAQRLVDLNTKIFTIGFGLIDECNRADALLDEIAVIGNGTYQHSSNTSELILIYENISREILTLINQTNQSVNVQGNISLSTLFGDSRIDFKYVPLIKEPNPGKISVVFEEKLHNSSCTSSVNLYPGLEIIEAEITSYSGPHWTDEVIVNGVTAFNLSDYFVPYVRLGDPFSVKIPVNLLHGGTNVITIQTGDSPEDRMGCSSENKLVYTALLPAVTDRTDSLEFADGCVWFVETITGSTLIMPIPEQYIDSKKCYYNATKSYGDYNSRDAYDSAMFNLLRQLDPLNEGRIIVDLEASDLEIRLTVVGSIPFMWGPTIAEVEVGS
jgi:hypothetical protein